MQHYQPQIPCFRVFQALKTLVFWDETLHRLSKHSTEMWGAFQFVEPNMILMVPLMIMSMLIRRELRVFDLLKKRMINLYMCSKIYLNDVI